LNCRDGLQNESIIVRTEVKVKFIDMLSQTGLKSIEATSFVSKKWVPQMGDATEVMQAIKRAPGVTYPVLVPNVRGLEDAMKVGVTEVCVFGAASESFSKKNTNASIAESIERFKPLCDLAKANGIKLRGYRPRVVRTAACCSSGSRAYWSVGTFRASWAAPTRASSPRPPW